MQGNVTLGYGNTFGKNAVDATLNAHISDYTGVGTAFYNWKYRYINYSGKLNYTYDNRYVAEAAFSYFGQETNSAFVISDFLLPLVFFQESLYSKTINSTGAIT